MADHVHPGLHALQPAGGNAPTHRVPPNSKLGQLATGDKPVLRLRQSRHPGIRPVCVNPRHHTRFPFDTHPQVAGPRVTGG
jgi:hypothetical protein